MPIDSPTSVSPPATLWSRFALDYPLSRTARRTPKLSARQVTMLGMDVAAVIIALVTLAAGFAAGWALARARGAAGRAGLLAGRAAARAEPAAARAEVVTIRAERDETAVQRRTAEA